LHLCVSLASAWEIAIKIGIGKLSFEGGSAFFIEKLRQFGVEVLHVEESHITTADENIQKYDVPWVW